MSIRDLEYVDDMALMCDSMDAMEGILGGLDASCSGMGLTIRDLEYVDDMVLVCDSMDVMEGILRALDASCFGNRVNNYL